MLIDTNGKDLSPEFRERLKQYDSKLDGVYRWDEGARGAYFLWSERKAGLKVHELTVERKHGETIGELERRIIKVELPRCDVWKNHGNGLAYDDWLEKTEREYRENLKKELREKHIAEVLDNSGDQVKKVLNELHQVGIVR